MNKEQIKQILRDAVHDAPDDTWTTYVETAAEKIMLTIELERKVSE